MSVVALVRHGGEEVMLSTGLLLSVDMGDALYSQNRYYHAQPNGSSGLEVYFRSSKAGGSFPPPSSLCECVPYVC